MANSNARDFYRDLQKIEKKLVNSIIRKAQKTALKPLAAKIKSQAPENTGLLEDSIKVKAGARKKGFIVTTVTILTPEDNGYVGFNEFGTREQPARPFIRPSAKGMKDEIIERFRAALDQSLSSL